MSDDMAESQYVPWIVTLIVRDSDGVEYDWMIDCGGGADTATDAIDRALRMCDEDEIVGLKYVERKDV